MAMDNKIFEKFSFNTFLEKYYVVIPMVQRDYAQGRQTDDVNRIRARFLKAIKAHLTQTGEAVEPMKMDFVYGEIEKIYDPSETNKLLRIVVTPLDGQQRLTTLYLLHWYATRKEKIDSKDYAFLVNFTYDIRPSSRDFCARLMTFTPNDSQSISEQILDQNWFQAAWHNDPTILGMLVMLDAIKEKFSDIDNLWDLLTRKDNNPIIFYFLPLAENGLSDELYIKMNSRGKKLTPFEHFKAEYEGLYDRDSEEANIVNHKFDVEWADTLFDYRDLDNTIDKEWMRYFFYISHILCYLQKVPKSNDEFVLIDTLYNKENNPKAAENMKYLEQSFDCWYAIKQDYGSIDKFFDRYLSSDSYQVGKVATYKKVEQYNNTQNNNTQNFFKACIKLYQVNNQFSYSDFLFLFGILTYLMNQKSITEEQFIERLRILRNLILNSNSGEIRADADWMNDLLTETEHLIKTGEILDTVTHGYNGPQEKEEQTKQERKKTMTPAELELLYKFEDHPLIYGFVSGLGLDNLSYVDDFFKIFRSDADYKLIHQALISIEDYTQRDNIRYYMGNGSVSTWTKLLHRSNRYGLEEKTMPVIRKLINQIQNRNTLQNVIDNFVKKQKDKNEYTWRYYFAKYEDMLRGADGELSCGDSSNYDWWSLNKHQFNGQHWNSFLNVINNRVSAYIKDYNLDTKILNFGNYGEALVIMNPISSIKSEKTKYIYSLNNELKDWDIPQDNGIDKVDRISLAVEKIMDIIKKSN